MPVNERAVLFEQQRQFADHLRAPQQHPAPAGLDAERLQVYRELFFNNVSGLLASLFPQLRSVCAADFWHALVRDFYAHHACVTPRFPAVADEFVEYLLHERQALDDPPWLVELAQFEWAQLALQNSEEELPAMAMDANTDSELEKQKLEFSPLCWPLLFRYPVHCAASEVLSTGLQPQETCLLLYRRRDDVVVVLETTVVIFRLLQLLQRGDVAAAIAALAVEMLPHDKEWVSRMAINSIRNFLAAEILLPCLDYSRHTVRDSA